MEEWVNRKLMKCEVPHLWRKKPLQWCRLGAACGRDLGARLGSEQLSNHQPIPAAKMGNSFQGCINRSIEGMDHPPLISSWITSVYWIQFNPLRTRKSATKWSMFKGRHQAGQELVHSPYEEKAPSSHVYIYLRHQNIGMLILSWTQLYWHNLSLSWIEHSLIDQTCTLHPKTFTATVQKDCLCLHIKHSITSPSKEIIPLYTALHAVLCPQI